MAATPPRAPPAALTRPRSRFVETDGSSRVAHASTSTSSDTRQLKSRAANDQRYVPSNGKSLAKSGSNDDVEDSMSASGASKEAEEAVADEKEELREPKGRHYKVWPRIPYVQRPRKGDGPWLPPGKDARYWINLFYDLAVASVLSTFSNAHELGSPKAIPGFLSYFILIQWMWATQTYYDIRFQAEDVIHRVYKAIQICLFVYIGAASRNWDLSRLRDPDKLPGISDQEYTGRELVIESFVTVVAALILSRALLAIQYIMSAIIAKQAGRRISFQLSSAVTLIVSTALAIVCVVIPSSSNGLVIGTIVLLYSSIVIEAIVVLLQLQKRFYHPLRVAVVADRYGALTLIILGEGGFNSLTRAFNYAISAFSDDSRSTYGQVFLAIGILFMLYLFLFSWFDPEEEVSGKRALAWQALHLPLHLGILLLLAAMVNTIIVISYAHGLDVVGTAYALTVERISGGHLGNSVEQDQINKYLSRLQLEPTWENQFQYLATLLSDTNPSNNASIVVIQYFGQVISATTRAYGLTISDDTRDALSNLQSINSTYTSDLSVSDARLNQAETYVTRILTDPVSDVLSGTLWLFPCAGIVLILAALRSCIWYRITGIDHYIVHGAMIGFGIVLSLLGLLAIGEKRPKIDVDSSDLFDSPSKIAPMYTLIDFYSPLIIVLGVYAIVYFGATIFIGCRRRHRAKRAHSPQPRMGKKA